MTFRGDHPERYKALFKALFKAPFKALFKGYLGGHLLSLGLTCCVLLQNFDIDKKMAKVVQETRCETVRVRDSQCAPPIFVNLEERAHIYSSMRTHRYV